MPKNQSQDDRLLCPSAQPDWQGSTAHAVVAGTRDQPRLIHISPALPVTEQLLALSGPVTPAEVFRFAAPCLGGGCVHFGDNLCQLVGNIVNILPAVSDQLPPCSIRAQCRWWSQEGRSACARCPQVVTDNYSPSEQMRAAALVPQT